MTGFSPVARGVIRWLTASAGGRPKPPPGPLFATTARFPDVDFAQSFRVMFRFISPLNAALEQNTELDILALDLVEDRLRPGTTLVVLGGAQVVAHCEPTDIIEPHK